MEPVGSACPTVTGEGQAHSDTKSSGLSQRTSAAQWGHLILCHFEPEHPLYFFPPPLSALIQDSGQ